MCTMHITFKLKFSDAQYCDFVVWNVDHLFVQRLCLDKPFITVALEKCKQFIKLVILPEILEKWYSWEPLSLSGKGVVNHVISYFISIFPFFISAYNYPI